MVIAIDAMGGDSAPEEIVKGVVQAAQETDGRLALVGNAARLEALLTPEEQALVNIVSAESVVGMDEPPARALRGKRDSSLAVAVDMVRRGDAHAVVSAGNSGAFMAMALTSLGRVSGVDRPAIAIPVPTPAGERILLDAGANVDCHPEHLLQFAILGSVYCERALAVESPRIGLLSIGTEQSKGNELTRAANALLREAPVNYVGYVEGNDIFTGRADVIVCDGFVGNVLLKTGEGLSQAILGGLRQMVRGSFLAKVGLLLMYPALRHMKQRYDYASYGGALLLGIKGICVVCHGRSDARAIRNAVKVAERAVQGRIVEAMANACEGLESSAFQQA
ncbi:MAG: phosphate acyltransferase PlsX [Armatimonadota bacterium]